MSFPGDMKLRPETAAEVNECATPNGMRRRLRHYSYSGSEPLVKAIFDAAAAKGLSGEDTMTWLAFEALKGLEYCKGRILERAMMEPISPLLLSPSDIHRLEDK